MIHKLRYTSKEDALKDLISKGAIDKEGNYINGTEAIVDCGIILLVYPTLDNKGIELIPAIYAEGYHYDVMTNDVLIFDSEIFVKNPKFQFAGQ
tara:strand:+ start:1690 stop:1971 length:282 start_codon:yes stop_codon:yes gene_type:complete